MKEPLRQARFLMAETDAVRLPPAQSEIVLVGRSNVGKSSTLCALCDNKNLARVSKMPGRTRGINVYQVTPGRWLVDLPGYGFAEAPKKERDYWPIMIGNYITGRPSLALVLVLVDAERGIGPMDMSMLKWLSDKKLNCRIVGTKVDKLGGSRQKEFRAKMAGSLGLNPYDIHWISSKKGYGMAALKEEVIQALKTDITQPTAIEPEQ